VCSLVWQVWGLGISCSRTRQNTKVNKMKQSENILETPTTTTSTDSTGVSVWTLRTCVVERVHRGRCCGVQMQCYHFHVEREHDLAT